MLRSEYFEKIKREYEEGIIVREKFEKILKEDFCVYADFDNYEFNRDFDEEFSEEYIKNELENARVINGTEYRYFEPDEIIFCINYSTGNKVGEICGNGEKWRMILNGVDPAAEGWDIKWTV